MKDRDRKERGARIYSELKQSRRFERLDRELAVVLLKTGDVVHHGIERALAPYDLSNEQYNALRILRGAGAEGHPTLEIGRRLISRSPNITRLLDKLVAKELARRDRDDEDRRRAMIRITPKGEELLKRCDRVVDEAVGQFGCLDRKEMETLIDLLERAREAIAVPTVMEGLLNPKGADSTETRN